MGIYVQRTLVERREDRTPLVIRGSFTRAFRSLAVFIETTLLLMGAYLIREAVARPLEASQWNVIIAGLCLALASMMLLFLMEPQWRLWKARRTMRRGARPSPIWLGRPPHLAKWEREELIPGAFPQEQQMTDELQRRFNFAEAPEDSIFETD